MLALPAEQQTELLRKQFRDWIKKNPPPQAIRDSSLEAFIEIGREWQQKLAQERWVAVHWPEKHGGRGLSFVEEAIVQEELARASAPQILGLFGLSMVGPVLIEHGTEQQQKKFLSKILSGEEIWCQGFSEPNAGSDLAAIKTKAQRVDGGYLVTGQKTWTSFAQVADWCFLLTRTANLEKKHHGLTYLLLDMKQPGITTRPLKQITGDEEFNELFLDQVFVPDSQRVGKEGDGWKIAISTLMHERVVLTFSRLVQSEGALRKLLQDSKNDENKLSPLESEELANLMSEACAVRALSYLHLRHYASGNSPGPEGSLDKLGWSQSFQRISKFAMKRRSSQIALGEESNSELLRYLYSRGRTIAAGTSEIQREIISDRILNLPRKGR